MNVLKDRMMEIARAVAGTLHERKGAQLVYCDGEGNIHARPWRSSRPIQLEAGAFACGIYQRDVSLPMLRDHLAFLRQSVRALRGGNSR